MEAAMSAGTTDAKWVYIAGPYTNGDPVRNTRDAIGDAEWFVIEGLVPICPHLTMLWHLVVEYDRHVEEWYQLDLEYLRRCDCLYRRPGDSTGADREVAFAQGMGIPVFYSREAVSRWAWEGQDGEA